jgi:uncharacterized protein YhhL (DUF1145 family)
MIQARQWFRVIKSDGPLMMIVLKSGTLAFYLVAILSFTELLPPSDLLRHVRLLAAAVLAVHAVEAIVMFKKVRLYKGPLVVSLLLTLIFGAFHLWPLAAAQRAGSKTPS